MRSGHAQSGAACEDAASSAFSTPETRSTGRRTPSCAYDDGWTREPGGCVARAGVGSKPGSRTLDAGADPFGWTRNIIGSGYSGPGERRRSAGTCPPWRFRSGSSRRGPPTDSRQPSMQAEANRGLRTTSWMAGIGTCPCSTCLLRHLRQQGSHLVPSTGYAAL